MLPKLKSTLDSVAQRKCSQRSLIQLALGAAPTGTVVTPLSRFAMTIGASLEWLRREFPQGSFIRDQWVLCSGGLAVTTVASISLLHQLGITKKLFDFIQECWRTGAKGIVFCTSVGLADDSLRRLVPSQCWGLAWVELAIAGSIMTMPISPVASRFIATWQNWRATLLCYYGAGTAACFFRIAGDLKMEGNSQAAHTLRSMAIAMGLLSLHGAGMIFEYPLFSNAAKALWWLLQRMFLHVVNPFARTIAQFIQAIWNGVISPCARLVKKSSVWFWQKVCLPICRTIHAATSWTIRKVGDGINLLSNCIIIPVSKAAWRFLCFCMDRIIIPTCTRTASCVRWMARRTANGIHQVQENIILPTLNAIRAFLICIGNKTSEGLALCMNHIVWPVGDATASLFSWLAQQIKDAFAFCMNHMVRPAAHAAASVFWRTMRKLQEGVAYCMSRILAPAAAAAGSCLKIACSLFANRIMKPLGRAVVRVCCEFSRMLLALWSWCSPALLPLGAWLSAWGFFKEFQLQTLSKPSIAFFLLATVALFSVALMMTGKALERIGERLARLVPFVESDQRFERAGVRGQLARFGYALRRRSGNAVHVGACLYINLDCGLVRVGKLAGRILYGGFTEIAAVLHEGIKSVEAVFSAVGRAIFHVFDSSLKFLWRILSFLAGTVWVTVKTTWHNPLLSILAVFGVLYSAYQIHVGRLPFPVKGFLLRCLNQGIELIWLLSNLFTKRTPSFFKRAWNFSSRCLASIFCAAAPVAKQFADEAYHLAKIACSLTENPWQLFKRPSFAALVGLQHLLLSRMARWAGHATQEYVPSAVWLSRAGFKQVFGPLFVFGSMGEICTTSLIVLFQIAALPGLLIYMLSSWIAIAFETQHSIQIDQLLQTTRLQRDEPILQQEQNRDRHREEILQWFQGFPSGDKSFDQLCIICQDEEYGEGDLQPLVLPCGHQFHEACIVDWLSRSPRVSRRCPMRCDFSRLGVARQHLFH